MLKRNFLIVSLLFICALANAQKMFSDKITVTEGRYTFKANAVIYLPPNYSPNKKYPLVIYAHHLGQDGNNVDLLYRDGLPRVLQWGYKPSFEFIMVAPQRTSYGVTPEWLPSVLEESKRRWNIDEDRIYLTGVSAGGWATWGSQFNVSKSLAKKFAAIVILSGATQDTKKNNFKWCKSSKTPIWAVVGRRDPSYLRQNQYMVDEINKQVPGLANLTIRENIGHGGWNDVYKGNVKNGNKDMWEWMYQYTLKSKGSSQPDEDENEDNSPNTPPDNPSDKPNIPGKIEAENFDAKNGVNIGSTLDQVLNKYVGWIQVGDWMDYNVNVATAGTYTITLRVASPGRSAQLQLKSSNGGLLNTIKLTRSKSYYDWITVTDKVTLKAGKQTLRIYANQSGWNINWFELELQRAPNDD